MSAPPVPLEKFTGAVMGVDHELAAMFQGDQFMAHYEQPTAGIGEETAIGFLTPALPHRIHLVVDAWADDESVLEIREDPVIVLDQGAALIVINRNRGNVASLMRSNDTVPPANFLTEYTVIQANAANLAGGLILHHETLATAGGAPFASAMNGVVRSQRGFLLLPDTEYVVILTSSVIGAALPNLVLNWMEHTDQNYKHYPWPSTSQLIKQCWTA